MHKIALLSLMALAPIALQAHNDHAPSAQQSGGHDAGAPQIAPFTVVPGWAVGDNTAPTPAVGSTHGGIVVDKAGLIYVSSNRGIFVFNDAGDLVNSFQDPAYREIHAMTLREEDGVEYIYAARNRAAEAIKLKTSGEIILSLKFPAESGVTGKFKPTAVTVKPNGNILVSDGYGTHMIFEFDPRGTYLSHFGGKAATDDKFDTPHGITLDNRYEPARLLIADRAKRRLVHFTLEGEFIGEVIAGLHLPCAVSIAPNGQVAVAELKGRVALLNKDNQLTGVLGAVPDKRHGGKYKMPVAKWKTGIFTAPHGLSWDHHGNLYVQDWNMIGRVTKWSPQH